MGPVVAMTAIVFGSAVAIAFGLNTVWIVFVIVRHESAQIAVEVARLPFYCLLFLALSAVSGAAMYGLVKELPWRWRAQWTMWASVALSGAIVWLRR